jgi:phosphotransferase system IIB component
VSNIFIRKKWLFVFIIFIILLSGCERNNPGRLNDYNLLITNNSPLDLKSIVVTVEENNDSGLIDNDIGYKDIAKFHMKNGKQSFKITINPKENYSVSKEFSETFNTEEIVEYQIIIESNEITIQRKL